MADVWSVFYNGEMVTELLKGELFLDSSRINLGGVGGRS